MRNSDSQCQMFKSEMEIVPDSVDAGQTATVDVSKVMICMIIISPDEDVTDTV